MSQSTHPSTPSSRGSAVQDVDRPFIHNFQTQSNNYVFDVNTGEILRVDDVTWNIIEDSCRPLEEVLSEYSGRYSVEQITAAYHDIERSRTEKDLFAAEYPILEPQYEKDYIRDKITHRRSQLILNVTEQCNFRCSYCVYTLPNTGVTRDHTARHMSWEVARAAIDDFLGHCKANGAPSNLLDRRPQPESPFPSQRRSHLTERTVDDIPYRVHIAFYGGEPLMNFPLIKRCTEYVRDKMGKRARFASFGLSTNGHLLKGEIADFLADHDFFVRVSLDGPQDVHDRHRRTVDHQPTWAVVVDNVRAFLRKRPDGFFTLAATVARTENIHAVNRYLTTADWISWRTGVSSSMASDPRPGYFETEPGNRGLDQRYRDYLDNVVRGRMGLKLEHPELLSLRRDYDLQFEAIHRQRWRCATARRHSRPVPQGGMCALGGVRTFVNVDGDYYPCERIVECDPLRIGNVSAGIDVDKVWAMIEEFVTSTRAQCERCWCLMFCPLACVAASPDKVKPYTPAGRLQWCEGVRDQVHAQMADYCSVLEKNPHAFDYLREYDKSREWAQKAEW